MRNPDAIRVAFERAAEFFIETTAKIQDTQWNQPGLGNWTIRDLVGHSSRALLTVEMYLARPADQVELERPVDYYLRAMASLADPTAVEARGREAGEALGPDPAAAVCKITDRVLPQVRGASDDALMGTPIGGIRLIDYLPTRIFELSVHTLDLAKALKVEVELPELSARVSLTLLADLALQTGKAAPLLSAGTGRGPLPQGYTVL